MTTIRVMALGVWRPRSVAWLLLAASVISGCAAPRGSESRAPASSDAKSALALDDIKPIPVLPPAASSPAPRETDDPAVKRQLAQARASFTDELWTEAIESAERAIRLAPASLEGHLLAGRAALQQGNAAAAGLNADEALRIAPREARAYYLRGAVARAQDEPDKAFENFRLALKCDAGPATAERALTHLYLGLTLAQRGFHRAARDQLEAYQSLIASGSDALLVDPELKAAIALQSTPVALSLADIYEHAGDHARAAASLAAAVKASPGDIALKRRWALALAGAGQSEAALQTAREVAAVSDDEAAMKLMDDVCRKLGKPAQSADEMERLLSQPAHAALAVKLANRMVDAGDTRKAITLLERAVSANTQDADTYLMLALLYFETSDWPRFTRTVQAALQKNPGQYRRILSLVVDSAKADAAPKAINSTLHDDPSTSAVLIRAALLQAGGQNDEQAKLLTSVNALKHDLLAGKGLLSAVMADLMLREHKWSEAISNARDAIAAGLSDSAVQLTLGDALEAEDRITQAEAAYRAAARTPPRTAEPLLRLAALQERRRDMLRAEQTYRQIVTDVEPHNTAAHEGLLRNLVTNSQMERAAEELRVIRRLKLTGPAIKRADALYRLISVEGPAAARLKSYREVLDGILAQFPDDIPSRMDLAYSWLSDGHPAEALVELNKVLKIEPDHVTARETKVEVLGQLLQQDEANDLLKSMIAERPRSARWRELMLQLALNRVDDDTAVAQLQALLKRDDLSARRPFYQSQLIAVLVGAGRFDQAIELARTIYESDPKSDTPRAQYVAVLERAKKFDQSLALGDEVLKSDPTRLDTRIFYIERLLAAKHFTLASRTLLAWMEDEPENDALVMLLVETLYRSRDYAQTIALLTSVGTDAANSRGFATLLDCYQRIGRTDEAVEMLESRARAQPDAGIELSIVPIYMQVNRLNDAERLINKQLEPLLQANRAGRAIDVRQAVSLMQTLAVIFARQHQEGRGEALLKQAYEIAPTDPGINNDLGYSWAEAGKNLDKAEQMIRVAVAAEPRQDAYLDSYGWLLYKKGDFAGAAEWLRRAVRWADIPDPTILDHAGDAQYQLNQHEQAKSFWTQARDSLNEKDRRSMDPKRDADLLASIDKKLAALETQKLAPVAPTAPQPAR